ncbi:ATP-binding protein [Desulfomarina sp.]
MTRLFLQLFAPVFIVTSVFLFNISYILDPLFSSFLEDHGWEDFRPIFLMLDDSLKTSAGGEAEDKNGTLKQLKKQFLFDVELLDVRTVQFPPEVKNKLEMGRFVQYPDSKDNLYHLSADTGRVWKLNLEQGRRETDTAFLKRIVAGPLEIITDNLLARHQEEWQEALKIMSEKYELPLSLVTLDLIDLESRDVKKLKKEGTLLFHDNYLEKIYTLVPGSGYVLKVGPFKQPLILKFADQVFLGALGGLMGFLVWLFLRPVWRDLRKLQSASRSFGEGQLQTRIDYSKYSTVKTILKAFNGMASHIQQLIASHKELTRAVSHELRTPVSRLRFSIEMLQKTDDKDARNRYLEAMNTDIDELDDMLRELLSYARMDVDRKVIEYSPVVLSEWLEEQVLRHKRNCGDKKVGISLDAEVPSHSVNCMDPKLMARALGNLIQNGCRYAGHTVHIHLGYSNEEFQLRVEDDGPGIAAESFDIIFDPFTRLDPSRDRDTGGYGLGLAIVKQIVEAHQGAVKVGRSRLGGAEFLISWKGES